MGYISGNKAKAGNCCVLKGIAAPINRHDHPIRVASPFNETHVRYE